jgi:hypothetical protein
MGSKKKETVTTNQVQEAKPISWADPVMQQIAGGITGALGQVQGVPDYTGEFIAQPGALQLGVPGAYMDAAALAKSLVDPAMQAFNASMVMPEFALDPNVLKAAMQGFGATNPEGMIGAVEAATKPVYRTLTEQLLPQLMSSGIESGAYGGTRSQQTLPGMVIRDAGAEMQDIAARLYYEDYNAAAERALAAYGLDTERNLGLGNLQTDRLGLTPDLLDTIMRMGGGSAELTAAAAGYDTANQQAVIDNMLKKYEYAKTEPFMGYDIATDLISRLASGYGTQTTNGTQTAVTKTGGLAPIVGGVLGAGMGLAGLPMAGGGSLGGSLVSSLFGGSKKG